MQTATRRPERAFTLIELLVVIAIIAILAAILFPVFAKAREKGRTASCVSNEKQLGLAFTQYKQDYDETWPLMGIASDNTQGNTVPIPAGSAVPNCYDELAPYVKSSQMWLCPSSVGTKAAGYNSYHVNGLIMTNAGVADAQLSQPALTTIAREPGDSAVQAGMLCRPYQSNSPATAGNDDALANVNTTSNSRLAFHTGGSNFLFADGHAKTMPFSFYNSSTGACRIVP